MEGAFTHVGNHLISDSASAINAGDDLSTIDADESALDREYGRDNLTGGPRGPKTIEQGQIARDDDLESIASAALVSGDAQLAQDAQQVDLPAHACAYVPSFSRSQSSLLTSQLLRHPQCKQCRQMSCV